MLTHKFQNKSSKASRIVLSVSTDHRASTTNPSLFTPPLPQNILKHFLFYATPKCICDLIILYNISRIVWMFVFSVSTAKLGSIISKLIFPSFSVRSFYRLLSACCTLGSQLSRDSIQSWSLADFYPRNSLETIWKTDDCWHRHHIMNVLIIFLGWDASGLIRK